MDHAGRHGRFSWQCSHVCAWRRGLDPNARYAVLKGAKGERVAELTGKELEDDGFEAVLPERCDGELYEIRIR